MSAAPSFPGLDGLMTLSRREGVDIRPTLLRVLTDLYVQSPAHSIDEERQFIELASRLIDQVDEATRAAVRARLSAYPATPAEILDRLGMPQPHPEQSTPAAAATEATPPIRTPTEAELRIASSLSMRPTDAAEITDRFFGGTADERIQFLHDVVKTPVKAAAQIPAPRAARAVEILELAAFAADIENFTLEVGEALILPSRVAAQVVSDPGGEPLACAMKALNMPAATFQRVLMFLDPERGSSAPYVFRLSRMYDRLSEHAALVMLAAWRGSTMAVTRAKYRTTLYDDERPRARPAAAPSRPAAPAGGAPAVRTGSHNSGR